LTESAVNSFAAGAWVDPLDCQLAWRASWPSCESTRRSWVNWNIHYLRCHRWRRRRGGGGDGGL